jgi:O-antigen/teichoic acid export membrane protein
VLAAVKQGAGDEQVAHYLRWMAGLPFVIYANTYLQIVLRIQMNNQAFSFTNMVYSVTMLAGNVLFTMWFGIEGLIFSTYLANVFAVAKSCLVLKKGRFFHGVICCREGLTPSLKKELVSYGGTYAATSFSGMVLLLLDVTCLDLIVRNPVTLADYKVASTIPMAFSFVPSCLIVYFYPKMVQAFSESKQAGRASVKNLSKLFFAVNGGVFLLMLLGAPLLIWIGFGDKYMNVVSVFRLLSVNYLIHAVQSLLSHVLAVIKRLKANLLLSLLSGLANIGLNILLIPLWGSMGAALATLSVTCLVTLLYFIYLRKFYKEA